ncbi:GroES-like protein [Penicillium argentinense]|uniref:GroES-like protein n=1 Tax=Penicillium argentinense TaxID=1131581 RepID=A0A9W9ENK9_9EURO|nr:GroES-like protein [Penicillium argentinense]KAJ5085040.1 GroES-like protein [Penicillium argentinense]
MELECTGVEPSVQRGSMLRGLVELTTWRYDPGDYEVALDLLGSGKISVKPVISHITPLERAPEAWE